MASTHLVSVVIPTYNHAAFVTGAIDSVWRQTFQDFEIIVVNDGSPDGTNAVLAPLVQSGKIHTYIHQENAGQGAARNRGIAAAQGEFIALLDDDDEWPPDKLAWQVETMRQTPDAVVVYGQPVPVDDQGRSVEPKDAYGNPLPWPWQSPSGFVHRNMADRCWLVSPGQALVRRTLLPSPPFDTRIRGCDDWDLWLRLAEKGKFQFVERPALNYRLHEGNASRDTLKMRRNEYRLLRKHALRNICQPTRLRYMLYQFRKYLRWTAPWLLDQVRTDITRGDLKFAREKMLYMLRFRPDMILQSEWKQLWRAVNQPVIHGTRQAGDHQKGNAA